MAPGGIPQGDITMFLVGEISVRINSKTTPETDFAVAAFADCFMLSQTGMVDTCSQACVLVTPYKQMRHELDLDLPANKALGHTMYVAGVRPEQYIWCELCGAYSGQRVQNLDKSCRGYKPRTQAVQRLNMSCNPTNNRPLAISKRRMTVRDVGMKHGWDLQGSPLATENLYASQMLRTDNDLHSADRQLYARVTQEDTPSTHHFIIASDEEENDPFGHGMCLE